MFKINRLTIRCIGPFLHDYGQWRMQNAWVPNIAWFMHEVRSCLICKREQHRELTDLSK